MCTELRPLVGNQAARSTARSARAPSARADTRGMCRCAKRCSHIASCASPRSAQVSVQQSFSARDMLLKPIGYARYGHDAATTFWQPRCARHGLSCVQTVSAYAGARGRCSVCETALAYRVMRSHTNCADRRTTISHCARHGVEAHFTHAIWTRHRAQCGSPRCAGHGAPLVRKLSAYAGTLGQRRRSRDEIRISRRAAAHDHCRPARNNLSLCAAWC